jgi:signal peptide peptidase SppA
MLNQQTNNGMVPFADQYVGVWSILERHANALLQQAQQINIQLHMQNVDKPETQAAIAAQSSTELNVTRDGIAIIELQGSLMKQASSMSSSRSMVAARRQVRAAAADPSIVGILLHIDSPGGTVAGTVDLADDVAAAAKQKPVHAYVDDLCASAAYWIASQCNAIYSNRSAEIGSIGVFMAVTDWSAFAEKEGAKVHVMRFGDFKGAGVAGTEITEAQISEWQKSVDGYGEKFIDAVAGGRRMAKSQARQLADGRLHAAEVAKELNLIDGIQSLDQTLAGLVAAGKNSGGKKAMSQQNETIATGATLEQLQAELPEASAEFILAQLKGKATMGDALKAYCADLRKQLASEREQREQAEAKLAAKNAAAVQSQGTATKPLGNKPMGGAAQAEETVANASEQYAALIQQKVAAGMTREKAARAVARENPQLRAALIAQANAA